MKNLIFIFLAVFLFNSCKKEDPASAKFSLIYNGNQNTSGETPTDGNKYDKGGKAIILGNDGNLMKTGFSFIGWNSNPDGSGTDYSPGSSITIDNSNITLYAKWWENSSGSFYKITYYGNGNTSGNAPNDNVSYPSGADAFVKNNTGNLERNGKKFLGWNTSSSGSGVSYSPNEKIKVYDDISFYAEYESGSSGGNKYAGFNASGQVKSKSSLTSSWSSEDLDHTFGTSALIGVVWNGSEYLGFNASGQAKVKSSLTSSWSSEDLDHTFGSSKLISIVWNGSKYVGFNPSGQAKAKSSTTSSWSSEDLDHTFGSSELICVVWNGSEYVGFNASGQAKSKSSLTSSWSIEDLDHTFGSSALICVVWNGSKYIGFNASGQIKSKSFLTSSWSTEDLDHTFGSSLLIGVAY